MQYQKLDYAIIKFSGRDSAKFLQSIITADINNAGHIYSLLLSPQGKFLFDLFISKIENDYYIEIASRKMDLFLAKIKQYIFRSQILVEHMPEYCVTYSHESINVKKLFEYYDPRMSCLGIRSIILTTDLNGENSDLYTIDKYKFVIPEGYDELIHEKSMPQEYGMDELNAISYKKGCYIGQEVISRVKYQGVIRKKIFQGSSDFDLTKIYPGSDIFYEDVKIGILCSSYKNLAICLIRTDKELDLEGITAKIDGLSLKLRKPVTSKI